VSLLGLSVHTQAPHRGAATDDVECQAGSWSAAVRRLIRWAGVSVLARRTRGILNDAD
jgi:hypothetical protein